VVGDVGHPGPFPLIGRTTIFEALTTAGIRETANLKKIYLLRGSRKIPFNYKDVLEGKHLEQDIPLQDGDRIIVPQ
jgi:polysaccharide export outer membrane protein